MGGHLPLNFPLHILHPRMLNSSSVLLCDKKNGLGCLLTAVNNFMINLVKCLLYHPCLWLIHQALDFCKFSSLDQSSGASTFDCLLTMNDNCYEIDHCSVRMMMIIKICNCNEIFGFLLICKRAGAGVGNLTVLAQPSII